MKYLHSISFILILFIGCSCLRKPLKRLQYPTHSLDSMYLWDIEVSNNGSQMFLDVPFQLCDTCKAEFLTLSVTKNKSEDRPAWISIILPCFEDQPEMELTHPKFVIFSFLKNTQTDSLEWNTDLLENDILGFYAGTCNDETFTYRMMNGYTTEMYGKNTVDVWRKFQEFDQVNFFINYSDGSEKLVKVPLHSYQKQYLALQ